ncbi:MAG: XRE family transcriptional regulator [Oscillospiraceae bacterium]|nr:XRE family transcriptional regulator [Oscillospiraceae bacterium]
MGLFGGTLKKLRIKMGLSQNELSKFVGVSKSSINMYERGEREPNFETLEAIADFFNVDMDYLLGRESSDIQPRKPSPYSIGAMQLARDYDSLDQWGKSLLRSTADHELARCAERAQAAPARDADGTVYYITSWFYHPMSAGTGEYADNEPPENLRLIKEPPPGTSFVAPIKGNSMEPTFHDRDKLFVRACTKIEVGQVGVFLMDGQQWVKELGDGVLISHNPDYPPRPMTEDVRCQGLVLGVCDDSYFP